MIKVLLVEDHKITADGLAYNFGNCDNITLVGAALTAAEGISMARLLQPHVVLLDLHLPDSTSVKSLLQDFLDIRTCKIIVLTADDRLAFSQLVLQMGAVGYLLKSEPPQRVIEAITQVMEGRGPVISAAVSKSQLRLTPVEKDILKHLATGMKYSDIAAIRSISPETVRRQCERLQYKLSLDNREQLIAWSVANGFGSEG